MKKINFSDFRNFSGVPVDVIAQYFDVTIYFFLNWFFAE